MYQIMTDSCCDIPYQILQEKAVTFIPMLVQMDGHEYPDDLGETFDYSKFLAEIQRGSQPTTSQINVGRYLEFFKGYVDQNIPVLYLCFSSGLSGSYQSALQAVEMLREEYDKDPQVYVLDTLAASLGQGLLVLKAAELRDSGLTLAEIVAELEKIKMTVQSWVTVDDLDHLHRGGRISKTAATLGGLMNVKPIINVDAAGKLQNVGKTRGRNKALQKVVEETTALIEHPEQQQLLLAYAGDLESAEKVKEMVLAQLPVKGLDLYPLGPTITSHTGYGCIALFSYGAVRQ
ncbi:DegV family protein [Enterococcus sp. LJL120]